MSKQSIFAAIFRKFLGLDRTGKGLIAGAFLLMLIAAGALASSASGTSVMSSVAVFLGISEPAAEIVFVEARQHDTGVPNGEDSPAPVNESGAAIFSDPKAGEPSVDVGEVLIEQVPEARQPAAPTVRRPRIVRAEIFPSVTLRAEKKDVKPMTTPDSAKVAPIEEMLFTQVETGAIAANIGGPTRAQKGQDQDGRKTTTIVPNRRPISVRPKEDRLTRARKSFDGDLSKLESGKPQGDRGRHLHEKVIPDPQMYGGTDASKGAQDETSEPQSSISPERNAPAPAPVVTFEALGRTGGFQNGYPPDPTGDVGPNHYIQAVNTALAIYDKSGNLLAGPFSFNTFMSQGNFGNQCDTNNFGDPIVMYDSFEDRWVVTDFAFTLVGGAIVPGESFECFAVSKTGDPVAGGWNFYSIRRTDGLNDYPKLGIWPDGIYMSANMFGFAAGGTYQGTTVWALNKAQMYAGAPTVQMVSFDIGSGDFTLIPSNARLQTGTPPPGTPNYFLSSWNFLNGLTAYKFSVNWNQISLSTFTGPDVPLAATSWPNAGLSAIPQLDTTQTLDNLQIRGMMQNAYSNIGGVESLWMPHTVRRGNTTGFAAPRWYQVNVTGGTVAASIPQAATWDPDAANVTHRWMPSLAVDRMGNMALGYSASSSTTFPSIRYAGRLATDPVNTFSQTEQTMFDGTGSQTGTNRWGDYTHMSLDPDGCTFWYTNQYYTATGNFTRSRVGAWKYAECTTVGDGTLSGTVTVGGNPLAGATVTLGSRTETTDANGEYSFLDLPAGTYPSISATAPGYTSNSFNSIVVSENATTTQNFTLAAATASACFLDTTQNDFLNGIPTNVDLSSTPGDVKLANPDVLDQQNTTLGTQGAGFNTTTWLAQTFTAAVTGPVTKADINFFSLNCGAVTMPNLTVSIRDASGNLPTGADLATGTISGFCNGGGGWYTVNFSTPATLTAGTQYALVWRAAAAIPAGSPAPGYFGTVSVGTGATALQNPYAGGRRASSSNSGSTWAGATGNANNDHGFRIYYNNGYVSPGIFISSLKDANPSVGALPTWSTISWNSTTPADTGVQLQVAASNDPSGVFNYVGPDDTAGTFFSNGASLSQFNGFRYLRYRAVLTTINGAVTPSLHDATLCHVNLLPSTLTTGPATGVTGGTTALSATLTDGGSGIGGQTINFTLNGNSVGSAVTDGNGVASLPNASLVGIGAGVYPSGVGASFAGNSSYQSSTASAALNVDAATVQMSGTKTVSGTFIPGGSVTYTVVLANTGNSAQADNPGNEFVDVLPAGVALTGATATSGTAMTTGNTVTWNGSIAANGGTVTITITGTVAPGTSGVVSNQGTINFDADVNGSNESNTVTDDPGVGGLLDPTDFTISCGSYSTVYVDDSWVGTPVGTDPDAGASPASIFGCDSFAVIQHGVNAVTTGGTVIVAAGTYNESQVLITKPVTVTGAGAATTIINGGTAVLATQGTVRIDLPGGVTGDVTFSGFTTQNPGVTGGNRYHITARQAETSPTITVSNNRMLGTVGGTPPDYAFWTYQPRGPIVFNNNELTNNMSNAILIENPIGAAASTNIHTNTISGNAFTAIFAMAYGGNDVTAQQRIANNIFDGAASSAISINGGFGGSTGRYTNLQITGNTINSLGGASARTGISLNNGSSAANQALGAIENAVVSGNRIIGTGAASSYGVRTRGLVTNPTITGNDIRNLTRGVWGEVQNTGFVTGAQINLNNIVNHTAGIQWDSPVAANAENNWWGCNAGPGNTGCSPVAGTGAGSVDSNPWIVLGVSASPTLINSGGNSTVTADMTKNSAAGSPAGTIPNIPVAFTATQGTMLPTAGTITAGLAASTFTSTSFSSGTACSTVDNQEVCTPITVTAPTSITIVSSANPSSFGQKVTFTATVVTVPLGGTPTGTVQFYDNLVPLGAPVVVSGGTASLMTSALAVGSHTITASYVSNSVSFQSSSGSLTGNPQVVNKANQTISVTTNAPANAVYNTTFNVAANATSGLPVAISAAGACMVQSGGTGTATILMTSGIGTCTVNYNQAGNTNFNAAPQVTEYTAAQKKTLTVTASSHTVTYGDPVPAVTPSYDGFAAGDDAGDIDTPPTCTTTYTQGSPVSGSPYTTSCTGGADDNYTFSFTSGTVTVGKKALIVTASSHTVTYGDAVPAVTASYEGFINGDDGSVITGQACTTTYTQGSPVSGSPYTTSCTGGTAVSYEITYVPGTVTVNKANTTTVITNAAALANSTLLGQTYAVNWTVTPQAPASGVTGTVTVTDGTDTCTAAVEAQTCTLTSTTVGVKNIAATYNGDGNFNASTSASVSHTVNLRITGNVMQLNPPFAPVNLQGVLMTLAGTNAPAPVVTDTNGNYSFIGVFTGDYTVTPTMAGKTFDPISRTYTGLTTNITNANFTAYNAEGEGANPRNLRVENGYTVPGQTVSVPLVLTATGNEARVKFRLTYDTSLLNTPNVACGAASGAGCTITDNGSSAGTLDVTVDPVAVTYNAGQREVAVVTFNTTQTNQSQTPLNFTAAQGLTLDASNNPLLTSYTNGYVVFEQGMECDLAGRFTGDGLFQSDDGDVMRQLIAGAMVNRAYNEFQRADCAPFATKGDGVLDATDFQQSALTIAVLEPQQTAGGPFGPLPAPPPFAGAESETQREMRVVSTTAGTGDRVTVDIELDAQGDETAASFTLAFDPMKLRGPVIAGAPSGTRLTANTDQSESGRVMVLVDGSGLSAQGIRRMVSITFDVAAAAPTGETLLYFTSDPTGSAVSDKEARPLPTRFTSGTVTISGPNAQGVNVSGRVFTPEGAGLRNAQVVLTDENGTTRTVFTSSLGYYTFEAIAPNKSYRIGVVSKRFRFESRTLNIANALTEIDFIAQE